MKYNIILTKDTAPLIVKRIEKMLSRKGSVVMNHKYIGAQKQRGYVQKVMPDAEYPLCSIAKSHPAIINRRDVKVETDNRADMQLIRINWDNYQMGAIIRYGTKMCIHSQKISYKELSIVDKEGMITTISI